MSEHTEGIAAWPTSVYVIFKKADIPEMKVVPATGNAVTIGFWPAI
jgi:hypothetical protein